MLGMHGGFVDNTGDFSIAAAMVILPHVIGGTEVYDQPSAWTTVIENSDLVVLWGATLFKNNQIGWEPTDHTAYEFMQKLKEKGTKVISIDPRKTDAAKYFDAEWVAPRPNTDTALMLALALAHTLYAEKLYDEKFVNTYTVGFKKFLPYLLGQKDGQPKTPEWAEKITTVPADDIRKLARRMAKGRTMIMSGWAIQRQDHGEQPYWMLVALAAMRGQIGLPGGGFGLSYHYANGGSLTAKHASLGGIDAGENAVKEQVPYAHGLNDMLLNPGGSVDYNGEKITYPDIRLIYWAGGNPFSHQMDRNKQIKAWQKPETIIVNEPFWSNTAKFADIVLPANTTFERNDVVSASEYSGRFVVAMPQLVEPQYESKSDFDIFTAISDRLGFKDKFTGGKTEMQWIESIYGEAMTGAKKLNIDMPAFDAFWKGDGYFEFPVPEEAKKYTRFSDYRADPIANALGTPSDKIEILSLEIEKFGYDDCPPHPTWIEPTEWLGSEETKKHPLHIISPHPKYRLHSQMDNTWLRDTYEVAGREPLWMNPEDAKARGIGSGDVVRAFNDRGALLAGAIVTDRIRQGVVMLHEGAWYDPDRPGEVGALCKHGNINLVTLDKGTSKLAQGNIANTALVEVEITGWSPAGGEKYLFKDVGLRISLAHLSDDGVAKRVVIGTKDDAWGSTWQQVKISGWIKRNDVVADLDTIWKEAAPLYYTRCSRCHSLRKPAEFTANQWPHVLKIMTKRAGFSPEQAALVTALLQNHGKGLKVSDAFTQTATPPAPAPAAAVPKIVGTPQLAAKGTQLFQSASCNACHGNDAKTPAMPEYPKLAGQNAECLLKQILDFKKGARANHVDSVMKDAVQSLSRDDAEAIAY